MGENGGWAKPSWEEPIDGDIVCKVAGEPCESSLLNAESLILRRLEGEGWASNVVTS